MNFLNFFERDGSEKTAEAANSQRELMEIIPRTCTGAFKYKDQYGGGQKGPDGEPKQFVYKDGSVENFCSKVDGNGFCKYSSPSKTDTWERIQCPYSARLG